MTGPERSDALRSLESELGVLTRRIRRMVRERARSVHADLQPAAYLMLEHLVAHGPQRASTMADALHLDKGAISRQVQQLEELRLVERTADPADGRAWLVSATRDAQRRLTQVGARGRTILHERLEDWSTAELGALAASLGRYNRSLEGEPAAEARRDRGAQRSQTAVSGGSR